MDFFCHFKTKIKKIRYEILGLKKNVFICNLNSIKQCFNLKQICNCCFNEIDNRNVEENVQNEPHINEEPNINQNPNNEEEQD